MCSSKDPRIDDRYPAAGRKATRERASMEQSGRGRLRVAWSENHARAQGDRRERALARLTHKAFGLAL